jgi:hypothetical protein
LDLEKRRHRQAFPSESRRQEAAWITCEEQKYVYGVPYDFFPNSKKLWINSYALG